MRELPGKCHINDKNKTVNMLSLVLLLLLCLLIAGYMLLFTRPECKDVIEDLYNDRNMLKIYHNCSELIEPLPNYIITTCKSVSLYSYGYIGRMYTDHRVWYKISTHESTDP